ncbi:MAG TPA: class I SAM-dependent methyltransferase [Solirubrobacteraceae bacterium]|nr:class I SAM-dependent methyltransferase [Solirubrobacteraceae bacterium]
MTSRLPSPQQQYATGLTRTNIERALAAAGFSPDTLAPADLAGLEDFHSLGRIATTALVKLAAVTDTDRVLDAGTGIGGTARLVAAEIGCSVVAVDVTPEYCDAARWLSGAVGLGDRIEVIEADVCELPLAAGSFDVVISQHARPPTRSDSRCSCPTSSPRPRIWSTTPSTTASARSRPCSSRYEPAVRDRISATGVASSRAARPR